MKTNQRYLQHQKLEALTCAAVVFRYRTGSHSVDMALPHVVELVSDFLDGITPTR